MQIDPQEYLKKLVEVTQMQCNQLLHDRLSLQTQLDLVLKQLEEVEAKLNNQEVVDVNTNTDT